MKVYIDTGIVYDYLTSRTLLAEHMRKEMRRGRTKEILGEHAEICLVKIKKKHEGLTSSLIFYELENSLFEDLKKRNVGVSNKIVFGVMTSRGIIIQGITALALFNIQIKDLNLEVFNRIASNSELQVEKILIGDSIHVITAIANNAEMIITGDSDILKLDGKFKNLNGNSIRCLETNDAKDLL